MVGPKPFTDIALNCGLGKDPSLTDKSAKVVFDVVPYSSNNLEVDGRSRGKQEEAKQGTDGQSEEDGSIQLRRWANQARCSFKNQT